jgi:DNA-binding LacI/PurR family transcriptional regulator
MHEPPNVPLVLLGEHRPTQYGDYVGLDDIAAARTVVRHLLEQGCRRIAPVGVNDTATASQRFRAFRAEMRKWRVSPVDDLTVRTRDWSPAGGLEAVRGLLARPVRPDAVFAFNDSLAYGVIRGLKEAGLRIPGDVAVAGMDDIVQSAYMDPPLTSLAPAIEVLADTAVGLLVERIQQSRDGGDYRRVLTPFELRVRESTSRLGAEGAPSRRARSGALKGGAGRPRARN